MVIWFVVLCTCLLFSLSSAKHIKYSEKEDVEIEIDIINSSQNYWIAAPNYITKKGSKYFKRLLGGKISSDRLPEKKIFNENLTNGVPASFDARSKWSNCPSIGSVTNQGHCGSCWAIATTSVMSDRICINTNGKVQVSISAQNLLSCCGECVSPHTHGCDGGYADQAYKHFQSVGLVTGGYHSNEGCQPYEIGSFYSHNNLSQITNVVTPPCSKKCTNKSYKIPYSKDKHKGKSSYSLPQDVTRIQTEIMEYGPVTATFDVYSDLKTYHSGVYVKISSQKVETHSVKVIGWGTENNVNYWLVVNSWGTSWGLNGLFKIRRGTNECGFESRITAGLTNT